jgi:target of rapamycin complex 2 subunit MAPKAP1
MNSDDLAKNLANRQLSKSPSPVSGSDGNFKAERENFLTYPGLLENSPDSDELLSQSSDICFAAQENAFFRFRTNTDARLERLGDIKRKQGNIKTVKCDDNFVKFNAEIQDDDELFVRKDLSKVSLEPRRSKLTEQLETLPPIAVNRFQKFSCHDGTSHPVNEVRTIQIFVMPFPKEHRDYPVRCCVQATTKIEEFIGFILFKCTQDQPEVSQQVNFTDIKDYGLFITDDTGEPDLDFPALDINEQIQRFQFSHLALAKRIAPNFQNRTLSVVSDTAVNPVVRQSSIETNKSLPSAVRRTDEIAMNVHDAFVEAPIYRAYRVNLISKKHFRTEVQLGISGEKVEIDPLQQKNSNYFFKSVKAIHYSMDSVAWCDISSRKSSRFEFKIAHNPMFFDPLSFDRPSTSLHESTTPTSFTLKIHSFETDPTSAEEIVMKINNILVLRTSSVRREYLNRHEKTKKSFIRKKKFPI